MRMRTIREAAAYVLERDPETALTPTAVRRLVVSGQIPSVRIGAKYLVALEALDAYLSGEIQQPASVSPQRTGSIRKLEVHV